MTNQPATSSALEVASDIEVDEQAYQSFQRSTQLQNIEYLSMSAERFQAGAGSTVNLSISPQFNAEDDRIIFRYDANVKISEVESDELFGEIKASLALTLIYQGGVPSDSVISHFGQTEGLELAAPYIREIAQNLAARIGFPSLILPLIHIPRGGVSASN